MSWDSPLADVAALVQACRAAAAGPAADDGVLLERLVVDSPVELQVRVAADGSVVLGTAPPRQALETTVMPVLHRLRVVVARDDLPDPDPAETADAAGTPGAGAPA